MPVNLTVTVPDPPTTPAGYLLVAFEVIDVSRERQPERGIYPNSTDGYEQAAEQYLRRAATGQQLAAVAWFADQPLSECEDGRHRMVSRYDALLACWLDWVPEERIGDSRSSRRIGRPPAGKRTSSERNGTKDIGDGVAAESM